MVLEFEVITPEAWDASVDKRRCGLGRFGRGGEADDIVMECAFGLLRIIVEELGGGVVR